MIIKHSSDEMTEVAGKYYELKARKKAIDEAIKEFEAILKSGMEERGSTKVLFGDFDVLLKKVAGSYTVDSEKLRADGLYEKYSKPKAGYTQIVVTKVDGDAIRGRAPF